MGHVIVTPKTMCNHNISRNEKKMSKSVILQNSAYYGIYSGYRGIFKLLNLIEFVWLLFPVQILLIFLRFELPPNCYRPQTWHLYLFFPACSISSIRKIPRITFKVGRSHDPLLQKADIVCSWTRISLSLGKRKKRKKSEYKVNKTAEPLIACL